MSEVNKSKVEQHRVRGRNVFDVVNQLMTQYNSSNGWAVTKVIPNLLSFEVIVERSVEQATDKVEAKAKDEAETVTEKDVLVEKKAPAKPTAAKTTKKSTTSADKLSEATKL